MSGLDALRDYAARIGADAALVQGAGGNVSLKDGDTLWIKASGTWLAQATSREIMVPVSLARLDLEAEDTSPFVVAHANPHGLRPSIETSMHAVLGWRVVVHVHCVETIAWAVRADAEHALAAKLVGFDWCFVPYVRPGPPLTREIAARLRAGTDVVVLGNHGLVVGADSVEAAAARVALVQQRLRVAVRAAPIRHERARGDGDGDSGYRFAEDPVTHATALDPLRLALARRGSWYPDHVIFLGPGVSDCADGRTMVVVPGVGVMLRADASAGAAALARCLADVTGRLDPDAALVTLTAEDEATLLGWDAEKYRQSLDQ